ncbi:hypothetical protein BH11ACT4_BH11ACT4_01380 [soil metagenome]
MADLPGRLAAARESLARGEGTVAGLVPWFAGQIEADAAAGRFAEWASSTVIDENTAATVVPRRVFDELHGIAGLPGEWPVGNAGLLHVYGYLLSAVPTPYGLKHERWTGGGLAVALGLEPTAFVPWLDAAETTLQRVTGAALPLLHSPAAPLLWIDDRTTAGELVRTIVIPGALAYGVGGRLTTVFPVDTGAAGWERAILDGPPRLRYNAVAEGAAPGSPLESRRVRVFVRNGPPAPAAAPPAPGVGGAP